MPRRPSAAKLKGGRATGTLNKDDLGTCALTYILAAVAACSINPVPVPGVFGHFYFFGGEPANFLFSFCVILSFIHQVRGQRKNLCI